MPRPDLTIKRTGEGIAAVNLGCGARTHDEWNNVDFSPYARLRRNLGVAKVLRRAGLLSDERWQRLLAVDPDIVCWDLRNGVPYADGSFGAVYHSHLLEHLPKDAAPGFLAECFRVSAPGAVLRVVVPDLERAARDYIGALEGIASGDTAAWADYDSATDDIFEQMVRDEGVGVAAQSGPLRRVERAVRGGADRIGERHLWMYDRHSLTRLLEAAGFRDISVTDHRTSRITGWERFGLDQEGDVEYIRGSLYLEAVRP